MTTLGLVTIGQAPRDDMRDELAAYVGVNLNIVEAGALDGMGDLEIAHLAPAEPSDVLVTRLRDGRQVRVSERAIVPALQEAVSRTEASGADFTLIVCTGHFPQMAHAKPLLFAGSVLTTAVSALAQGIRVSILCPDPNQLDVVREKWQSAGVHPLSLHAASPYENSVQALEEASLNVRGADLVVMDCMGYSEAMALSVRHLTGTPVVTARRVVARMAGLLA